MTLSSGVGQPCRS